MITCLLQLLLLLEFKYNSIAEHNSFHISNDLKLCRHASYGAYSKRHCVISESCNEMKCLNFSQVSVNGSSLYFSQNAQIHSNPCHVISFTVNINILQPEVLTPSIDRADNDYSIRKIIMHIGPLGAIQKYTEIARSIGLMLDVILKTRPWWRVGKEPYDWQNPTSNKLIVILDRYLPHWERHWRHLTSVHFPPSKEVCARMPILVGRSPCIHPGWFSVGSFYSSTSASYPFAVSTAYVPYLDDVTHQQNAFISLNKSRLRSECPLFNRSANIDTWQCAFLPTTNCSLPKYVTDCRNSTCVLDVSTGFQLLLDRAAEEGHLVPPSSLRDFVSTPQTALQQEYAADLTAPPFFFSLPANLSYVKDQFKKTKSCWLSHADSTFATYMFGFLFRMNSFYRSRVAKIVHQFREAHSPYFDSSTRCVAVHLRRGDRVMRVPEGINYTAYCYNATNNLPCTDAPGGECDTDAGCGTDPSQPPFIAITLSHVLDKVSLLVGSPSKGNEPQPVIYVASDDSDWVEREIARVGRESPPATPRWKIVTLRAPKLPRHSSNNSKEAADTDPFLGDQEPYPGYFYMRSQAGTESGTYLFASMELATQCEAFIGHMGCGGTMLHYQYMCMQHAGKKGICPPVYDMRRGLLLS